MCFTESIGRFSTGVSDEFRRKRGGAFPSSEGSVNFFRMYFIILRPQKKREKEEQKMRNNMRVGDEITTIGGICGRVVTIRDDSLVIETGADRNKMTIKKWAVQSCDTVHDPKEDDDDDDDDDDI